MTGLAVLVLVAPAPSARGDETSNAIAASLAVGAVTGMMCWALASGDEDPDLSKYARRGLLVGLAGSSALETFENEAHSDFRDDLGSLRNQVSLSVDNGFGLSGRIGYRCHPRFSAEAEVEWINGFDVDVFQPVIALPGFGQSAEIAVEPIVVTVNAKGYILTGRYQPFLLAGAGVMMVEQTKEGGALGISVNPEETAFVTRVGLGIDVSATEHVVVSLDASYLIPFDRLDYLDYVSINWGVEYRF